MWLVVGKDCIIANFFFKNLVNFYIARNRLDLSGSLPTAGSEKTLDIVASSINSTYDVDKMQNSKPPPVSVISAYT